MWRKGETFVLLVGTRLMQPLWKAVWRYLKKLKMDLSFCLSNPTYGNMSERTQNTNLKEHKHSYVHCSAIYNCQDKKVVQVSISRWVDKQLWGIHRMEYYLAPKNKKILSFLTVWMDLENIMLCEISQLEKDKYHMTLLMCEI